MYNNENMHAGLDQRLPIFAEKILALGNTASVMPTIAKEVGNLYVACPTNISPVVLQGNEKCFPADGLNYPLSVSCYGFVKKMSRVYGLFHAELGYAVACDAAGVAFGVHLHGVTDIALLFPKSALGRFLKRPYRKALMNAKYVVCHPAVLGVISRLRKDAVSLPLAFDPVQFNDRIEPSLLAQGITIFSPSRMDRWKGHEIIWAALGLMKNKGVVTVCQSDWGWEPEYSLFKKNAPENVRMTPVVPREKIASYYKGATIVMGQMKIGHFGMTEVEAAACGAPVLVYLEDQETPFLPKHNDPQALADAMDCLVESEELRARYARSCKEYAVRSFGVAAVSSQFLSVISSSGTDRRGANRSLVRLFMGTCFEILGRVLGERAFGLLKSRMIGL